MSNQPLRVIRPVPVPRQFWVVGAIHGAGAALLIGFVALAVAKLGADAIRGDRGDANLFLALALSATIFIIAFAALWALHYWIFIRERSRTTYAIYADRVEVAVEGSALPRCVIPLDRVAAVQTWAGPLLRPLGLATLTLIVDEPSGRPGPAGHRWFPLPNIPDPDSTRDLIRSLVAEARG